MVETRMAISARPRNFVNGYVPSRMRHETWTISGEGALLFITVDGVCAVALSEGLTLVEAARFGCATAGISVTRPGTALAMPTRTEVESLLQTDRNRSPTRHD